MLQKSSKLSDKNCSLTTMILSDCVKADEGDNDENDENQRDKRCEPTGQEVDDCVLADGADSLIAAVRTVRTAVARQRLGNTVLVTTRKQSFLCTVFHWKIGKFVVLMSTIEITSCIR